MDIAAVLVCNFLKGKTNTTYIAKLEDEVEDLKSKIEDARKVGGKCSVL